MELRWPSVIELPAYVDALERGWSPNTIDPDAGIAELDRIRRDPDAFLAALVDRDAAGSRIPLPDGSTAERLPGVHEWMWDGAFVERSGCAGAPARRSCRRFSYPAAYGKGEGLRYRVPVASAG